MRQVTTVAHADLVRQLGELGVRAAGVLVVHTSFSAARPVADGPLGLIRALREAVGSGGTLVMPTMTDGQSVFDPASTPTHGMGVVAELFWRQPGVVRSTHPGGSFAAFGKHADAICAPQPLEPPHGPDSPIGRAHALDAQVLLLGVSHGENTTLHLAENMAGAAYFIEHPCVVAVDGKPEARMIRETDHCCEGFNKMNGWLRAQGLQREGIVGHAASKLVDARALVAVAGDQISEDPFVFLCDLSVACRECAAARASVVST